jgi:hypothetical protein
MGVDVLLYVEGNPPADVVERAEAYFVARSRVADRYEPESGNGWLALVHEPPCDWHSGRVIANITCRYYGPGYERGDWPGIYGAIRLMQHLFPESRVYYGGDTDDSGIEVTDEYLDEIWHHWLGPHGDAYYARR